MELTLGQVHARVASWLQEPLADPTLIDDAINDAIEQLWEEIIKINISLFLGGPVSLDMAAASERTPVVTIQDPITPPTPAAVAGGTLGARTVYVAYTMVTPGGSETNLSPAVALNLQAAQVTSCPAPANTPPALGWNCYMGSTAALLARQNPVPIDFAFAFQEPNTGEVDAPDAPPPPTFNSTGDNIFYIRRMELANPTTGNGNPTYRKWQQADIDSALSSAMAATQADSTLPYQNYAWDFASQSRVEVRPALGAALSPRFFFINKPYRLAFPNSPIPFTGISHTRYIRYEALAVVLLSLNEYESAQGWEQKAAQALAGIRGALTQTNWAKDVTIRPYLGSRGRR